MYVRSSANIHWAAEFSAALFTDLPLQKAFPPAFAGGHPRDMAKRARKDVRRRGRAAPPGKGWAWGSGPIRPGAGNLYLPRLEPYFRRQVIAYSFSPVLSSRPSQ